MTGHHPEQRGLKQALNSKIDILDYFISNLKILAI